MLTKKKKLVGRQEEAPVTNDRVPVLRYKTLADTNNRGETREWPIIIPHADQNPSWLCDKAPRVTTPICTIDEYATKDFISQERKQITEQTTQPLRVKKTYKSGIVTSEEEKTKTPYPPNLSMTPASNIDPASEAST